MKTWIALVLLAAGERVLAQEASIPTGVLGEGALENDVFLPRSLAAERRLAEGDRTFVSAGVVSLAAGSPTPSAIVQAFEAWRDALVESAAGDAVDGAPSESTSGAVPFPPDPDATGARRTEAVEYAVLRRLAALDPSLVAAWKRRFEEIAARELAAAHGDVDRLVLVEHQNPATRAAVEASIVLADLDFESGESTFALQRLERAGTHLAVARDTDPRFLNAIERRSDAIRSALERTRWSPTNERWRSARRLIALSVIPLAAPDPGPVARSQRGVMPRIAIRDDGSSVVQAAERVVLISAAGEAATIDLAALVGPLGWSWMPPFNDSDGEWPLLPASLGAEVVLVAGRSQGSHGNALVCLDTTEASARLRWGYSDRGFAASDGRHEEIARLLGPGLWGFDPGPLIAGGLVLVQARQWGADGDDPALVDERESRAWCLAFDLGTGLPRWKRLLAIGADAQRLRADVRPSARGVASPASPLAAADGRLFVGTELGAAALLEICDGRPCWTLESRRRPPAQALRRPSRAPVALPRIDSTDAGSPQTWLWAPADSDRVYRLQGGPVLGGRALFACAAQVREEDEVLETADAHQAFFSSRSGERAALVFVEAESGRRAIGFELAREEGLGQGLLLSEQRAYHATSRALYLFDREHDLALLDARPLAASEDTALGGVVAARGDRVFVVDRRAISIFRAE